MHNLSDRVTLAQGNCLEPLRALSWWERAQMVVSNPPYVRAEDYDDLAPEITQHEPREALIASDRDGLRFYRQLLPECAQLPALRAAAFEVGAGSAPAVAQLVMDGLPEFEVAVRKDYGGIERVVSGRRMRGVD